VRVEVDCFDPASGRPRWSRSWPRQIRLRKPHGRIGTAFAPCGWSTWMNPFDVLIPGPASGGAGVISGPERGPLLAGDLVISQTEEGGLAAVQTSAPSG
jgi:hypothetical protein